MLEINSIITLKWVREFISLLLEEQTKIGKGFGTCYVNTHTHKSSTFI